ASDLAPEDPTTLDPAAPATVALLAQTEAALAQAYALGWRSARASAAVASAGGAAQGEQVRADDSAARAVQRARALYAEAKGRIDAAEALGEDSGYIEDALDWKLLQWPRDAKARWGALPPAPTQDLRGVVAVAMHAPAALDGLDGATPLAGLFVDEWMETIPTDVETT